MTFIEKIEQTNLVVLFTCEYYNLYPLYMLLSCLLNLSEIVVGFIRCHQYLIQNFFCLVKHDLKD